MKQTPKSLLIVGLAVLAAGGGGYAYWSWRTEARWEASLPPRPDLQGRSPALKAAIDAELARLAPGPQGVAALGQLAKLYLANGYLTEAEAALRSLLQYDQSQPMWTHLLACLLSGFGRLDEAAPLFQKTTEKSPEYLPARLRLGDVWLKTNHYAEAQAAYEAALRLSPNNPYALLGLARLDLAQDRWTAARIRLDEATRTNPGFSAAFALQATVLERLGNNERAVFNRERAETLGRFREMSDPWWDDLWKLTYDLYRLEVVAATHKNSGQPALGLPMLERAHELAPKDGKVLRQLASLQMDLHHVAEARAYFEQARALAPGDPAVAMDLISVYKAQGDTAAVRQLVDESLKLAPYAAGLHFEKAVALADAKETDAALREFRETIRLSPENLTAYEYLANLLLHLDRGAEAAQLLEAGIARDSNFVPGYLLLAKYRITQGEAAKAAALLHSARALGATGPDYDTVASAYQESFGKAP